MRQEAGGRRHVGMEHPEQALENVRVHVLEVSGGIGVGAAITHS
jgi:hypothetical protein